MDPTLRSAAQRVNDWHMARILSTIDSSDTPAPDADAPKPIIDPERPGQNAPVRDPAPNRG